MQETLSTQNHVVLLSNYMYIATLGLTTQGTCDCGFGKRSIIFLLPLLLAEFPLLQILMSVQLNMTVQISVLTQRVLTHVTVARVMYLMTMVEPVHSTVEETSQSLAVHSTHLTGQSLIHPLTSAVSG